MERYLMIMRAGSSNSNTKPGTFYMITRDLFAAALSGKNKIPSENFRRFLFIFVLIQRSLQLSSNSQIWFYPYPENQSGLFDAF